MIHLSISTDPKGSVETTDRTVNGVTTTEEEAMRLFCKSRKISLCLPGCQGNRFGEMCREFGRLSNKAYSRK